MTTTTTTTSTTNPGARCRRGLRGLLDQTRRGEGGGFDPVQVGWRVGDADVPAAGGPLWIPYDRTTGVFGPQGSGKTLDLLAPALLAHPGPAITTLTKPGDLLLTITHRAERGPVHVLDPFTLLPGAPPLIFDPIAGCHDPQTAERRAKAFVAGATHSSPARGGEGGGASRFYQGQAVLVLQGYLHAAALAGHTLTHVLAWAADPRSHPEPEDILRTHPGGVTAWADLLHQAVHSDDPRTAGNTASTLHDCLALFYQPAIAARCTPTRGRPATDVAAVLSAGGTIYLLGREDPYSTTTGLMTAVVEHLLDTALRLAHASPWGRLCPPLLAVLDELPSTAPIPTLPVRLANDRALGISYIYATQTRRQLDLAYGHDGAHSLTALTNNLIVFGGAKDHDFNRGISDLIGTERITRYNHARALAGGSTTSHTEDAPTLLPKEIRALKPGHALLVPDTTPPVIARLHRCVTGPHGPTLLAAQAAARHRYTTPHHGFSDSAQPSRQTNHRQGGHAAEVAARLGIDPDHVIPTIATTQEARP